LVTDGETVVVEGAVVEAVEDADVDEDVK